VVGQNHSMEVIMTLINARTNPSFFILVDPLFA